MQKQVTKKNERVEEVFNLVYQTHSEFFNGSPKIES